MLNLSRIYIYKPVLSLVVIIHLGLLFIPSSVYADNNSPILIISSYNPDTHNVTQNITAFLDEYKSLNGKAPVVIENMNCKSLPEALLWKGKMKAILSKYKYGNKPQAIIILGQEGWSSFISLQDSLMFDVPLFCGMVSRNAVLLPDTMVDLSTWAPESVDIPSHFRDNKHFLLGGFMNEYTVGKNINLVQKLYPNTQNVALITDNSYGGVSLQALVKAKLSPEKKLNLILLDGRNNDIYTIINAIKDLPPKTVLLLGTWRVDMNDEYYVNNATYAMMSAAPSIPAFTLTSTGLGHWCIGGFLPDYKMIGKDLARQVVDLQNNKIGKSDLHVRMIPSQYVFDERKLKEFQISERILPESYKLINEEQSPFFLYRFELLLSVTITLLIFVILISYYFVRTNKLKNRLLSFLSVQRKTEKELRKAKEKAEESDRLKSAFLANMSHEIRTPLNAIVGFSTLLVETNSQEDKDQFLSIISNNNELLLHLINDILDLSKIEAGTLDLALKDLDINMLLSDIEQSCRLKVPENVLVAFTDREENCHLLTDKNRLSQVILNLINNSIKFTSNGSILFGYQVRESEVYFFVTDTGFGISEDGLERIFQRFVKLDPFSQGSGLGLSICRTIIEKMGGKIGATSQIGKGSTFWFTLPDTLLVR